MSRASSRHEGSHVGGVTRILKGLTDEEIAYVNMKARQINAKLLDYDDKAQEGREW